ncbi:hypothetical protein QW180_16590 [Vibrio sinaloensis]|nr:hypothetical protein [Vibrio sinaloensis]
MKDEIHHDFIGVSNKRTLDFARYLQKNWGKKTWIRYVVVPGYTDDEEAAHMLGDFIKDMDNIEKKWNCCLTISLEHTSGKPSVTITHWKG